MQRASVEQTMGNRTTKTVVTSLVCAQTAGSNAVPGGLQNANMQASIELGKKRMRDSNDDLLMVPLRFCMFFYTFFFK